MRYTPNDQGFTLLELLIALAVVVTLLVVGMPDFESLGAKQRLKGAVQSLKQDLQFVRSETIKRNEEMRLTFTGSGGTWCYGVAPNGDACDCTKSDECLVEGIRRVRTSDDSEGIELASAQFGTGNVAYTVFEPVNGLARDGATPLDGTVALVGMQGIVDRADPSKDIQINVNLSLLGSVSACSDAGNAAHKYGYEVCP